MPILSFMTIFDAMTSQPALATAFPIDFGIKLLFDVEPELSVKQQKGNENVDK